jgi:hypothetical protein
MKKNARGGLLGPTSTQQDLLEMDSPQLCDEHGKYRNTSDWVIATWPCSFLSVVRHVLSTIMDRAFRRSDSTIETASNDQRSQKAHGVWWHELMLLSVELGDDERPLW